MVQSVFSRLLVFFCGTKGLVVLLASGTLPSDGQALLAAKASAPLPSPLASFPPARFFGDLNPFFLTLLPLPPSLHSNFFVL